MTALITAPHPLTLNSLPNSDIEAYFVLHCREEVEHLWYVWDKQAGCRNYGAAYAQNWAIV